MKNRQTAVVIVKEIITELKDRSGFGAWWSGVDESTQREILGTLIGITDYKLEIEARLLDEINTTLSIEANKG